MSDTRIELARMVDGEPMLSAAGVSLLMGIPVDWVRNLGDGDSLPADWVKSGRRRAGDAKAHTGSHAMLDGLRYWAERDLGLSLVQDAYGNVFAVNAQ